MKNNQFHVGELVQSLKGRDEGRIYMVYKIIDNDYVSLVDGNFKLQQNPKLKKVKHMKTLSITLDKIENKLLNNIKVFDSEIYSAMKKAQEQKTSGSC